jgi:hypothetical protein
MDLFGLIHIFDPITALLGDHDSHHAIHDGHHHDGHHHDGHHHHGWLSGEHYHSHHLHHFDSDPISLLCADGNGLHSAPEPSAFVTVQPTIDPNHPDVLSAHYTNWSDNWVEILPVTHIDGDAAQDFHSTVGLLRLAPHETHMVNFPDLYNDHYRGDNPDPMDRPHDIILTLASDCFQRAFSECYMNGPPSVERYNQCIKLAAEKCK